MTNGRPSVDNQDKKRRTDAIVARVKQSSAIKFHRNQIVYSQGDSAVSVFYVRTGKLKVAVASENGRDAVAAVHLSGNFFGEECLTGHKLRIATVTALTECELVQMPKASVADALHNDPEFSELFTTHLMERSIRVQADLVDQLLNSTEKRLARLLLILANYGNEDRPEPIVPKINQETLAGMIGTSRTHVNHFMNKFRKLGFIEYNGAIKVNRSLLNLVLHERPHIAERD
jgi:CRP/FNR family transcriptional regulator, cyclic AMP receptor protein